MTTLVIDTGQDIVGIWSDTEQEFRAYRGDEIPLAVQRVQAADEVVTYNGEVRDLEDLRVGLPSGEKLPLKGKHTDMRIVIWSDRIWGSSLLSTYFSHFDTLPAFTKTYEGSNECDVYMTRKLWELWKQGRLRILDGHSV